MHDEAFPSESIPNGLDFTVSEWVCEFVYVVGGGLEAGCAHVPIFPLKGTDPGFIRLFYPKQIVSLAVMDPGPACLCQPDHNSLQVKVDMWFMCFSGMHSECFSSLSIETVVETKIRKRAGCRETLGPKMLLFEKKNGQVHEGVTRVLGPPRGLS